MPFKLRKFGENFEHSGFITLDVFGLEVLELLGREKGERKTFSVGDKEYVVKTDSLRYHTFKQSHVCAVCGLVANVMVLQQRVKCPEEPAHFNLFYHDTAIGRKTLFTKDHIIPKSKGGPEHVSNMRTLCCDCNEVRMNYMVSDETILAARWLLNTTSMKEVIEFLSAAAIKESESTNESICVRNSDDGSGESLSSEHCESCLQS